MMSCRWLSGVMSLSLLLFFSSILFPLSASAQNATDKPTDVRIVIDISGSMKQTDPDNLRIPALNLLVELLPDGAQSGVWTFGRYVNMLVPLDSVDQAWREQAKQSALAINSVGLQTNLVDALDKARWKIAADSGFEQSVILLTDGHIDMVEPGADALVNTREKQRLLDQVLPQYIQAGARIHTLALSNDADIATLQQIALETGGLFLQANQADDLLKVFLKAFDRAVPAEQVPMVNNTFDIDDSVQEFTALVFRQPGGRATTLITPDGQVLSQADSRHNAQLRWHQDLNFDLITIKQPQPGRWSADAALDPDNRVQILTDLKLSVSGLPGSIFAGYPVNLTMALTEKDQVLQRPEVLALTDFTLKVTAPDGRSGSKLLSDPENLPTDGVFRESLTRLSQQGEYQIEVIATGRTFQRRQLITATLMEPLTVTTEADYESQVMNIYVTPQVDNIDRSLSRIIARVTSPDDSSVIHSMIFDDAQNRWHLALSAGEEPGNYEALLNIRGVTSNGSHFKSKPESIVARFPLIPPGQEVDTVTDDTHAAPENTATEAEAASTENIAPNLAQKFEQQNDQPPPKDEPEAASTPETTPTPETASTPEDLPPNQVIEEADGIAWWIYLLLALGNLAVFGGIAFWWFRRRSTPVAEVPDASANTVKEESVQLPPDLEADFDAADLDGDFDTFEDDGEEEISIPAAAPGAGIGEQSGKEPSGDDLDFDDEFAIDPDEAGDDWGEFDEPEDQTPEKSSDNNNEDEPTEKKD